MAENGIFTSDLHLGHNNIINLRNRPFINIEEMDRVMIENWNRRVKKNDAVYVMGDIILDKKKVAYYMEQLILIVYVFRKQNYK